ncbi:hypothetical protein [Nitrososphaera viennensis]|uniref:Nucleotidyltransferase n=2 Tax=Nitrososphaera viennensis TaxID=1034015 RepID=A0A060HSJ1_9ARCH|nr:hypothetical protein [Nitrososphaera viennensis]AIC16411.1 hypothetical protein NVIE_021470 [Nitrososphaera viennensis EN76]UVS68343.1 hypothetical protein NWT39_10585 [Nitrososphaera viennensis]
MHPLIQEAIRITEDIGDVIFVGAVGIFLQTKATKESQDLDFAVAKELRAELLDERGYFVRKTKGKEARYTPRGYKIDIYTRDVSGIPIDKIIDTAKDIEVRKGVTLKAASIEVLAVSKFRAAAKRRGTDDVDIRTIVQRKYKHIDWNVLKSLTEGEIEFKRIKDQMDVLHRMQLRF